MFCIGSGGAYKFCGRGSGGQEERRVELGHIGEGEDMAGEEEAGKRRCKGSRSGQIEATQ